MEPVIKLSPTSASSYGKSFTFPRRGHPDYSRLKKDAYRQASEYGERVLQAMASQKGQPLTTREIVMGKLELPNTPAPTVRNQPAENPDANPFAARLAELRRARPLQRAVKAQVGRRIDAIQELYDNWERTREVERQLETRNADEKVKLMREHAQYAHEHSRLDNRATPTEVNARQRLLDFANSHDSQPADYWALAKQADDEWYERLDGIANEKRGQLDAAKADLDEARNLAKSARKVDHLAEPDPAATEQAAD